MKKTLVRVCDTVALGVLVVVADAPSLLCAGVLPVLLTVCCMLSIAELVYAGNMTATGGGWLSEIFPIEGIMLAACLALSIVTEKIRARELTLVVLSAVAGDATAMFFGLGLKRLLPKTKGTRKIFAKVPALKRISPCKSYIGFFGEYLGGVAAAGVVVLLARMTPDTALKIYIFTAPIAAAAGDLLGSVAKRAVGIKDSGDLLGEQYPLAEWFAKSRGGYLDFMDSIATALLVFCSLVGLLR